MQTTPKLHAGSAFPEIQVLDPDAGAITFPRRKLTKGADWQMIVVYRGRHCPMCTKFLNALESYRERLLAIGIDLVAISGDSKEQLLEHKERLDVNFPLYHGLSEDDMKRLGVWISLPRSEKETDHNFSEPGLFVVNSDGNLQVVDISNNPFMRPDIEIMVGGLEWIRNPENNYPIRGTATY